MQKTSPNNYNNSIVKAFGLLENFSRLKPQWGVRELAREIGAHESTCYRLMSTLESLGVLYKNPDTDKYALGLKLYELGNRVRIYDSFVSLAHPELLKVAAEIEETVHLGIARKSSVLMIDKVESEKGLKLDSHIGQTSPMYCTGLGKILLAFEAGSKADLKNSYPGLKKFTRFTIDTWDKLNRELMKIRERQFAIDRQEYELGLICVAVPVYNCENRVVAALSAAGPSDRFKEDHLLNYLEILKNGAEAIRMKIGNYKLD